jgi:hypothetical protein
MPYYLKTTCCSSWSTLLLLTSLLFACQSTIDIDIEDTPRVPVINALITPDGARAHLSWSFNYQEDSLKPIHDAQVSIRSMESGISYALDPLDAFNYNTTNISFAPGAYLLSVIVDGYPLITAHTSIPNQTTILGGKDIWPAGYDEYGDGYNDLSLIFDDQNGANNYYEVFFVSKALSDISFQTNHCIVANDPSVLNTGLEKMDSRTLLFNDALFADQRKELKIKYCSTDYTAHVDSKFSLTNVGRYAILRDVSEEYYTFRRSWVIHNFSKPDRPAVLEEEPILEDVIKTLYKPDIQPLYSNIENGYGIFIGYREQLFELKKINPEQ